MLHYPTRHRHRTLAGLLAAACALAGILVAPAAPASADANHQAVIGMPFTGKWAYNVNVNPPYTDANSSHPSVHHAPGGGDWATDLYAAEGTAVKLEVPYATGTVTYSWGSSSTSCGQSTLINISVGGVSVGWLYFAHINNAVHSGPITNGMTLGTVHDWGGCNPGVHVHVEFRNTTNYACYVDHGHPGVTLGINDNLGVLGSTNGGTGQACTSVPSAPPTATDSDGDGIPDGSDECPTIAGQALNQGCPLYQHTVTGDFNGDGKTDLLAFYNYGSDNIGAWLFPGAQPGPQLPTLLWTTGTGQWNWNNSTFIAGDFNGDGHLDALAFYNYGGDNLGAFLFAGTGSGVARPSGLWTTGPGQWNMNNSKFVPGDFNGDGRTDVLAFYNYGSDDMGTFLFTGTPTGIDTGTFIRRTGSGQWNMNNSKFLPGDFNGDGRIDVLAFYNYGSDNLGAFLYAGDGTAVAPATGLWTTGPGQWNMVNSKFVPGDFNGDGRTDVLAFYNYGSDDMGTFLFTGTPTGIDTGTFIRRTGPGQWNTANSLFEPGDFNGDGHADAFAFYNYGTDDLGAFLYGGDGTSVAPATGLWTTGNGQWNLNSSI